MGRRPRQESGRAPDRSHGFVSGCSPNSASACFPGPSPAAPLTTFPAAPPASSPTPPHAPSLAALLASSPAAPETVTIGREHKSYKELGGGWYKWVVQGESDCAGAVRYLLGLLITGLVFEVARSLASVAWDPIGPRFDTLVCYL